MEDWSTDEVISAERDIDENGYSINAQDDLFTLFEKFSKVNAEYCNSTNEFRVDNKMWFLDAQKAFYSYAARISRFLVNQEATIETETEQGASANPSTEEPMVETDAEWLSYAQCRRILQPVMNLERGKLTTTTMKEISNAVKKAQANAKEIKYDLGDFEQVIIALVHEKFDTVTKSIWEFQTMSKNPTFAALQDFLRNRSDQVSVELRNQPQSVPEYNEPEQRRRQIWCAYCKVGSHTIFKCDHFDTLTLRAKTDFLQREGRCLNCLTPHGRNPCPSGPCRTCDQPHNSLLCRRNPKNMG